MTLKVNFILRDGKKREFDVDAGQTLLDVARRHNIDIEGACGGAMACSTCHLIIDKEWYGCLPLPTNDEIDIMELALGITRTSRLGCQIRLTEAMDGLTVRLPP